MTYALRNDGEAREAEAARWVVRIESAVFTDRDAVAFDAWLLASPDNAAAFDDALSVSQTFTEHAAPLARALSDRRVERPMARRHAVFTMGAMAAAAAIAVVAVPDLAPSPSVAYATGKGERSTIRLADGSKVELNSGTNLTVKLTRDARTVVLAQGQAVFDVAHDPGRPFLIEAGDRTVRVVGTQFDVRRRDGRLAVTVARGSVEVRPAAGVGGRAYRLHPGQRLEHREGVAVTSVAAVEPNEVLGWRSGRLVYREQPLRDVVADLNQQFDVPIRIADPSLAAAPISGVLILDDQDAVLRRLALLVPMGTIRSGPGVVLRREAAADRE